MTEVRTGGCQCGAVRYELTGEPLPDYWHLKAGTLDDTSWLNPVAEGWTPSAQPWLDFSDRLLSFARDADVAAIRARWQSRKAGG